MTSRAAVVIGAVAAGLLTSSIGADQGRQRAGASARVTETSVILGRPTDRSIAISVLAPRDIEAYASVWASPGQSSATTAPVTGRAGVPFEIEVTGLRPNTRYAYRLHSRPPGDGQFAASDERSFMTARAPGSTFSFGVQGDSHPERDQRMYDADLYRRTLDRVRLARPDFYVMLGDDFSIERLITGKTATQASVDATYAAQRPFLGRMADSTALFLVNGNHEEAARFLLDGTPNSPAVYAGRARTRFYPLPAPDHFYSGNTAPIEHVGLPRDYYAWTWGDALFVTLDPYWHSTVQVDARADTGRGGRGGNAMNAAGLNRDLWQMTLGDAQYAWLKKTLETSQAKFKFVFAHHVLGTGRGAVEMADLYEWGGRDPRGRGSFTTRRPTWAEPIHPLMVRTGVTIFFQGHDHLFARQEKDGIVYQAVPNPADLTYTAFNKDAYRSGDILPNSGHLLVTVGPESTRVDYVRSYLPKDETATRKDGEVAFSYAVTPRVTVGVAPGLTVR